MFAKELKNPYGSPTTKSSFQFKTNQLIINSLSLSNKEITGSRNQYIAKIKRIFKLRFP